MQLDQDRPIYQQVARHLCRQIVRGDYSPGEKLPTVRELALAMGVNPNTIQRSCNELEREGVLRSQRGLGIFVTDSVEIITQLRREMADEAVTTCLNELSSLGLSAATIQQLISERLGGETG